MDFDTELAETYITQVRQIERGGGRVRSRPAINQDERLQAREVRQRVDRITLGYRREDEAAPVSDPAHCALCGQRFTRKGDGWLFKSIYTRHGRVDLYRCVGGCPTPRGK